MACYHPLAAWQCADGSVVFYEGGGRDIVRSLFLSCGQCVGCRLERSRQWATRCMHEAQLYDSNVFLTLTYDDAHYPTGGSLNYRDFQLFMKRLRKHFFGRKIRFFMCGEYGEEYGRPHFHACVFNLDFPDKVAFKRLSCGSVLYTSADLSRLWPYGFVTIGDVSFESAAYVARYVMKKVTGPLAASHYRVVDRSTGEVVSRDPEFCRMSLRPGIGADWLRLYWSDVQDGKVVVRGQVCNIPKAYRRYFKRTDIPAEWELARALSVVPGEFSDERLAVKEQVAFARVKSLKRSL